MSVLDERPPIVPGRDSLRAALFAGLLLIPASVASCSEDPPASPPPIVQGSVRVPRDFTRLEDALAAVASGCTVYAGPGTYRGAGNRDLRLRTPEVTILGVAGAESTMIDCGGGSGLHFGLVVAAPPESAYNRPCEIQGLSIRGARAVQGAALWIETTPTVLEDCPFVDNAADSAGAVYVDGASVRMTRCRFRGNRADGTGGGLLLRQSEAKIQFSVFEGNDGAAGAALASRQGRVVASQYKFVRNGGEERSGSAIWSESSTLKLGGCLVAKNRAATAGGGVHLSGADWLQADYSTFAEKADDGPGGALHVGSLSCVLIGYSILARNCGGGTEGYGVEDLFVDDEALVVDACCLLDSVRVGPTGAWQALGPGLDGDPGFVRVSQCGVEGDSDFELAEDSRCRDMPQWSRIGSGQSWVEDGAGEAADDEPDP